MSSFFALICLTTNKEVSLPFRLFMSVMMIVVVSFPLAFLIGSGGTTAQVAIVSGFLIAFGLQLSLKWYVASFIQKQQ